MTLAIGVAAYAIIGVAASIWYLVADDGTEPEWAFFVLLAWPMLGAALVIDMWRRER